MADQLLWSIPLLVYDYDQFSCTYKLRYLKESQHTHSTPTPTDCTASVFPSILNCTTSEALLANIKRAHAHLLSIPAFVLCIRTQDRIPRHEIMQVPHAFSSITLLCSTVLSFDNVVWNHRFSTASGEKCQLLLQTAYTQQHQFVSYIHLKWLVSTCIHQSSPTMSARRDP
jgi:hypothetical protein